MVHIALDDFFQVQLHCNKLQAIYSSQITGKNCVTVYTVFDPINRGPYIMSSQNRQFITPPPFFIVFLLSRIGIFCLFESSLLPPQSHRGLWMVLILVLMSKMLIARLYQGYFQRYSW